MTALIRVTRTLRISEEPDLATLLWRFARGTEPLLGVPIRQPRQRPPEDDRNKALNLWMRSVLGQDRDLPAYLRGLYPGQVDPKLVEHLVDLHGHLQMGHNDRIDDLLQALEDYGKEAGSHLHRQPTLLKNLGELDERRSGDPNQAKIQAFLPGSPYNSLANDLTSTILHQGTDETLPFFRRDSSSGVSPHLEQIAQAIGHHAYHTNPALGRVLQRNAVAGVQHGSLDHLLRTLDQLAMHHSHLPPPSRPTSEEAQKHLAGAVGVGHRVRKLIGQQFPPAGGTDTRPMETVPEDYYALKRKGRRA